LDINNVAKWKEVDDARKAEMEEHQSKLKDLQLAITKAETERKEEREQHQSTFNERNAERDELTRRQLIDRRLHTPIRPSPSQGLPQ
jgi:hypothetical protein